eukprot:gene9295-1383_t
MTSIQQDDYEIEEDKIIERYGITWLKELKFAGVLVMFLGVFALMIFTIVQFMENDYTILDSRIEDIFSSRISKETCKTNLEFYTRTAHMGGTKNQVNLTKHMKNQFEDYFSDLPKDQVKITTETYDVLLSYPTDESKVELFEGNNRINKFDLIEDEKYPQKEYRGFLAYSPSGEIEGNFFYVNYGRKEDFDHLKKLNYNLTNSIVISRYGKLFRGIKVRNAEKAGCKGIIIYSDPQDDGISKGPVYPDGPNRPENGIQRGNVMYPEIKGDPTTPGFPSIPGTINRIKREEVTNLPQKILAIPMNQRDAKILLSKLEGPTVPESWKGDIKGIDYKIGSQKSNFKIKMKVKNEEKIKPIQNLFVIIRGETEPDREIIVGNHRDAWIFGGVDPHGGTISFLEVVKSTAYLLKNTKWKPRRTIIFASWDAEEHGLLGSVEWVEHYSSFLKKNVVAYINLDLISGLHFKVSSSPALSELVREISTDLTSPFQPNTTLDKSWGNQTAYVGGGSDFTPFFHHLGISVIDLSFKQTHPHGTYHSIYENYDYYSKYVDPNFDACFTMSKMMGLILLKLSTNHLLNFELSEQTKVLKDYFKKLEDNQYFLDFKSKLTNQQLNEFNFHVGNLNETIKEFNVEILKFNDKLKRFKQIGSTQQNYEISLRLYNDKLSMLERTFTKEEGIFSRPWYKHVICSIGTDLGYGFEVFPALMDAMRLYDFDISLKALEQLISSLKSSINFLQF